MNKHAFVFTQKIRNSSLGTTFVSGDRDTNVVFFWIFLSGLLFNPLTSAQAQTASVQFIHSAEGQSVDTVDVYLNNTLIINDFARYSATSFLSFLPIQVDTPSQIVLAPAGSASAAEGFFSQAVVFETDGIYTVALIGDAQSMTSPLDWVVDEDARVFSSDTSRAGVSFLHAAPSSPAFDVLLREGGMIIGDLGYAQFSPYLNLKPEDIFLDVKWTGTSNIISTYRLSLSPYKGQALKVFAVGSAVSASSFKMFAVYNDGFVSPVDFAPVARVQYFNALADTVDIYKNGTRFSNDAVPGAAMPFKYIPAGIPMNIAVSPFNSLNAQSAYGKFDFTFDNLKTYLAVSAGIRNDALHPLQMFFYNAAQEASIGTGHVSFLFFQGNPDWPMVDVRISPSNDLFAGISYGAFKGYQHLKASGSVAIRVYEFGSMNLIAAFAPLDLAPYKGQSVTLFTKREVQSGHTSLWVALADGTTFQIMPTVATAEQMDPAGPSVLVFPNPATSELNVQVQNIEDSDLGYQVIDARGSIVLEGQKVLAEHGSHFQVEVNSLFTGLYFLHISTLKGSRSVRFWKR